MNKLSLKPDPHMRWIYDYTDPRYNDPPQTVDLRNRRRNAIDNAPQWMIDEARMNDNFAEAKHD